MQAKTIMRLSAALIAVGTILLIIIGLLQPAQKTGLLPTTESRQGDTIVGSEPGNAAPNFTLPAYTGKNISLSDLRGKTVILNFWSMSCASCLIEMPDLQQAYYELKEHRNDIVLLGVEAREDDASQFLEKRHLTFPIVKDQDASVWQRYNIRGIPTTFLLDRNGIIKQVHEGPLSADMLKALLRQHGL